MRRILLVCALAGCGGGSNGSDGSVADFAGLDLTGVDFAAPGRDMATPPNGSVVQHHNHANRDGVFVATTLTRAKAAAVHMDPAFDAALAGPTYAQPLFVTNGPGGAPALIVADEQDNVYAVDAATGAQKWMKTLGAPVALGALPCGNIDPLGITGTPFIDEAARVIYLDAMTTPDGGNTKQHLIFALSLDDGSTKAGWPVDVNAKATSGGVQFDSSVQNQRGALAMVAGRLYVPYGGHYGDCGAYHGWVVGVNPSDPTDVQAWATDATGGGIWGPSGVSSDGVAPFATTGNTFNTQTWKGGDAVVKLQPGPRFSGLAVDYFAPANWLDLDNQDLDLGGTGALVVDVPGAGPSALIVTLGKDGHGFLVDRTDLGGVGKPLQDLPVAGDEIIGAAASYRTAAGTYVAFRVHNGGNPLACPSGGGGNLGVVKIAPASPPTMAMAWCSDLANLASPVVSTTDGTSEAIVWITDDTRLYGFDGDAGSVIFDGGGASDQMGTVQYFQSPIVAGGRIYVAAQTRLYAFAW